MYVCACMCTCECVCVCMYLHAYVCMCVCVCVLQGNRDEGPDLGEWEAQRVEDLQEDVLLHHAGRHAAAPPHHQGGHDGEDTHNTKIYILAYTHTRQCTHKRTPTDPIQNTHTNSHACIQTLTHTHKIGTHPITHCTNVLSVEVDQGGLWEFS